MNTDRRTEEQHVTEQQTPTPPSGSNTAASAGVGGTRRRGGADGGGGGFAVYVSGRIAGLTSEAARAAFAEGVRQVRASGRRAVNPFDVSPICWTEDVEEDWDAYMRGDIAAMLTECDTIAMLPNWQSSKGARLEMFVAMSCGLAVEFLS